MWLLVFEPFQGSFSGRLVSAHGGLSAHTEASSYCAIICAIAGPATIHLLRADGSSVIPTAPPSPLITAFAYSCAWSIAMPEKYLLVLRMTNFPA